MARAQSSLAISAAFCSMATIVRPESSATILASGCPFETGANGTMVVCLSGVWALITTHSITIAQFWHGSSMETVAHDLWHYSGILARRRRKARPVAERQLGARRKPARNAVGSVDSRHILGCHRPLQAGDPVFTAVARETRCCR